MTIFDKATYPYITPVDPYYETCEHCRAEFWIHSNEFSREELKAAFGTKIPASAYIQLPNRPRVPSKFKGVMGISSDKQVVSKDLRDHVDWLCGVLEKIGDQLDIVRCSQESRGSITCFWWSKFGDGAPTLWPSQLSRLSLLNFEFSISFSYYGEEDD